jgi:hypothetical protein
MVSIPRKAWIDENNRVLDTGIKSPNPRVVHTLKLRIMDDIKELSNFPVVVSNTP